MVPHKLEHCIDFLGTQSCACFKEFPTCVREMIHLRWFNNVGLHVYFRSNMTSLPHNTLCLSFSCNLIGYFKQALKSDCLFCF